MKRRCGKKQWMRVVASIRTSTRDNFRVFVPTQSFTRSLSTSTVESETPVCGTAEQRSARVSFLLECWRQAGKWIYLICAMCESIMTCPPSTVSVCAPVSHRTRFRARMRTPRGQAARTRGSVCGCVSSCVDFLSHS